MRYQRFKRKRTLASQQISAERITMGYLHTSGSLMEAPIFCGSVPIRKKHQQMELALGV